MQIVQRPHYLFLDLYPTHRDAATQSKMNGVRDELTARRIAFFTPDPSYIMVDAQRVDEAVEVARAAGFSSVRTPVPKLAFNPDHSIYQKDRNTLAIVAAGLGIALLISFITRM